MNITIYKLEKKGLRMYLKVFPSKVFIKDNRLSNENI